MKTIFKTYFKFFVMKTIRISIAILLVSLSWMGATAQQRHSLKDENRRIHHGAANGQLTQREVAGLKMQEAHLRNEAMRYKINDGRIDRFERRDLKRDNRRLSRNIYRQKHDCQKRF
jgi:hypothetical protein